MRKTIAPVYQPIIDVDTGIILHYEALARTRNSIGDHGKLIELGELLGFIDLVDIAMLEHVVEALRVNPRVVVAVNVSGVTIDRACNELLAAVFKNMDFMRRVIFEITETSDIRDQRKLTCFLKSARLLDARIALDDFGTGFCTLDLIRQVQPEFVKLDGDVVRYFDDTGDATAIREVVSLVHGYGGDIIAEHVDSKRKADAMRDLGVRYLQGFYVGEFVTDLTENDLYVIAMDGEQRMAATWQGIRESASVTSVWGCKTKSMGSFA